MKYYAAIYFYALAVIAAVLALLIYNGVLNIAANDGGFVVAYDDYFLSISLLSLLTGVFYSLMKRFKKPISDKTGLFHFVFIIIGLFFTLTIYRIYFFMASSGAPDTSALATSGSVFILIGPLCLFIGLFIFIYGIIKAFKQKQSTFTQS